MSDILIRNVPSETVTALKARAKEHGRSLQAEVVDILTTTTQRQSGAALVAWLETVRPEKFDSKALKAALDAATASIRHDRDTR